MSNITLDCIIFGLQKIGGISNYWSNLIKGFYNNNNNIILNLPKIIKYSNFQFLQVPENASLKYDLLFPEISRYLCVPQDDSCKFSIFHTSYYRWPCKPVSSYIVSVYDFTYEKYMKALPTCIHKWQKYKSIRSADKIICISNSTKIDLLNYLPNINQNNIFIVPLAVDNNLFFPDLNILLDASNLVLFVGGRTKYKRFDLAIEALRAFPNLKLGIVGQALSSRECEYLKSRLHDRWIEFGLVSVPKLRALYSSAHAFIFPSDYEGFGLPLLESMACGCPIICSSNASLPEIAGDAALYADTQTADAYIYQLQKLESRIVRHGLVEKGLKRVEIYSWENTVKMTMNLYA